MTGDPLVLVAGPPDERRSRVGVPASWTSPPRMPHEALEYATQRRGRVGDRHGLVRQRDGGVDDGRPPRAHRPGGGPAWPRRATCLPPHRPARAPPRTGRCAWTAIDDANGIRRAARVPVTRRARQRRYLWMMLDGQPRARGAVHRRHRARPATRSARSWRSAASWSSSPLPTRVSTASPPSPPSTATTTARRVCAGAAEAIATAIPATPSRTRLHAAFFEPARARHGADVWDAAAPRQRADLRATRSPTASRSAPA